MPPPLPDPELDDEDYASEEDSDFAPEKVAAEEGESSDSEDDTTTATKAAVPTDRKRKQAGDGGDHDDAGFENSGDEAIIGKAKKRRKKGQQQQARAHLEDDEGGEGGLIKTRSMRAVEKAERKAQAVTGPVTIDVDALWASMTAAPVMPTKHQPTDASTTKEGDDTGSKTKPAEGSDLTKEQQQNGSKKAAPGETIKIRRTYKFAGKVHTEEKIVARDSAEARLYLASHPEAAAAAGDAGGPENHNDDDDEQDKEKKRMPRKAFRSVFEPVLGAGDAQAGHQRMDLNLAIAVRLRAREEAAAAKAKKLNTVEKSRMDWAGFVDKEGIKDELALAGRAKGSFADRQDFLARSEAKREEEARRVRLAGKAA